MLHGAQLKKALLKVRLMAVHGPWWRAVAFRYLSKPPFEPLYASGSKLAGMRFTPKGSFDSLYLANDPVTALAEVNSLIMLPGGPVPMAARPYTIVAVNGIVSRVLDLCDATVLATLKTTEMEMTGAWATSVTPQTQVLAQAAYDSGIVAGIRYGSAKNPGLKNLVVFTERLVESPTDYLEVHDPDKILNQRISA